MVTPVLLDTNVISAMRVRSQQDVLFQRWVRGLDSETSFVSAMTLLELRSGVLKKSQKDKAQGAVLATWFERTVAEYRARTVVFDTASALVAAQIWQLRTRDTIDLMIAATAMANGLTLVTRNTKDFADIPGLSLINPWEPVSS